MSLNLKKSYGFLFLFRKGLSRLVNFSDSGAALILVIWVIALLGVMVSEFVVSSRTTVKATRSYCDATKSYYIAEAGMERAINALNSGKLDRAVDLTKPVATAQPVQDYIWRVNSEMSVVPFGDGFYKVWIGNESGKVNLNSDKRALIAFLFGCLGYDKGGQDAMADCIQDWTDTDSMHRANGAETDYYSSLPLPYKAKDGYMTSLDEILYVKGMTVELYYSSFFSELATVLPWPEEKTTLAPKPGKLHKIIFIKPEFDYSRININAALPHMLSILPGMNETLANNIVEYRKTKDITSLAEIKELVGESVYEGIRNYFQVTCNEYYSIDVEAWCGDYSGRQHIRTLVAIDVEHGKKQMKIIHKMINPDIYRGFEYHSGTSAVRR